MEDLALYQYPPLLGAPEQYSDYFVANEVPLRAPHSTNDGIALLPSKSRPCDACRKRKSRCVLKENTIKCVLCEFHDQSCTYIQTPQARKRKSVSISQDEEVIASSKEPPIHDIARRSRSQQNVASPTTDQLIDDYANLKGPSLLKKTLGLQRRRHGTYLGSSGGFEPALQRNDSVDLSSRSTRILQVNSNDHFILLDDEKTDHYENELSDLDAIEAIVQPHGKALINLYFRIVHPSFPILHKKVYLEKYNRTYREFSPPLLAAVYILALGYWSYESELSHFKMPKMERLEALATKTLAYVVHRPKLSTVEAGLLLLQRRTGSASWCLSAQMVAVGQELGLHRDCSSWNIPGWERGLRKRLAWALFMQDKWSSLIHGRPSHIFREDWTVQCLVERDFPENAADDDEREGSADVEKGRSIFCHMVSLTQILADVLQTLYSNATESGNRTDGDTSATKTVLSRAKPLQMRLNAWHASLPSLLSMENVTVRKLSSTGYLHLAYWATESALHRCIFRTLRTCSDKTLGRICHNAARTRLGHAIAFVKCLKPEHLQSFWYFASSFNFALVGIFQSLLCIYAQDEEGKVQEVAKLDEYRWVLRVSSKSAGFLEQSIATIDLYAGNVKAFVRDAGPDGPFNRRDSSDSYQKDMAVADRIESPWLGEDRIEQSPEGLPNVADETGITTRTNTIPVSWYAQLPLAEEQPQNV